MALGTSGLILFYVGAFYALFVGLFYFITFLDNRHNIQDPKVKKFPKVSIIVPAYNEEKTISKTLRSLLKLNYPKNKLDIIVVDDGSTDNTYGIAKKFPRVRVFRKENGGKGSALNFALKKVRGEFVGVLDADSFATRNTLRSMIGHFKNEKVMAVTPTLRVHNPKGFLQRVQYVEYLFSVFFRKIFSFLQSVYVTPGPLTIYRKSFFDKHGGFDEKNITEDLEIALRIQTNDYEIQNSINAEVFTVAPGSFRGLLKQRVRWFTGLADNLYTYRHLFGKNYGNLGIFVLPVAVVSILLVLAHLTYYGAYMVSNIVNNVYQIYLVNFDLPTLVKGYFASFSYTKFTGPITLLILLLLVSTTIMVVLAKVYSKEKTDIKLSFILYTLTYGILVSFWWFTTFLYKILNVRIKW